MLRGTRTGCGIAAMAALAAMGIAQNGGTLLSALAVCLSATIGCWLSTPATEQNDKQ